MTSSKAKQKSDLESRYARAVAKACRLIESAETAPKLVDLARAVGMSSFHFHRIFSEMTGLTPKAYAVAHRAERMRQKLAQSGSVTEAIYEAGYGSNGRFYAESAKVLGMPPRAFKRRGAGTQIHFAVGECSLGSILVAASENGVCAILLGDDPNQLAEDLQDRFHLASLIGGDSSFEETMAKVVGLIENPKAKFDLPLDLQGTIFQQKVWRALTQIPVGETLTYSEIADRIGMPKAVRAVAGACAANRLAVAIPCHRVIRMDGGISGYRWGVERKRALLRRESEAV